MNANIKRTRRSRKDFSASTPLGELLPLSSAPTEPETGVSAPPHSTPQPSPKPGEASAAQETGLAADCSSSAPGASVHPTSAASVASHVLAAPSHEGAESVTVAADSSKALTVPERAKLLLKSEQTERDLRALLEDSQRITVITNADGRAQAHAVLMRHVRARTALDDADKVAREDMIALTKGVIDEKKRLAAINAEDEKRIRELRDAWDKKIEDEKRARAEAEQRRKDAIEVRIEEIRNRAADAIGKNSADIAALIEQTTAIAIDDTFAEFRSKAESVQKMTLDKLRYFHQSAVAAEEKARELAEQEKRLAAEREAQRLRERRMEAISDINGLIVVAARGRTLAAYDSIIEMLERREVTDQEFGDLVDAAISARDNTLSAVKQDRAAIAAQLEQQAETNRLREAEEADRARKAKVRGRIDAIRAFADGAELVTAERVAYVLKDVRSFKVDDSFAEMRGEAQAALDAVMLRLVDIHGARVVAEAETARLAEESRRIDEQKREQERQQHEAEEARKIRDERIGSINFIRAVVGMSASLETVSEFDSVIADTKALDTSAEEYGDLSSEATAARDSTLDILRARRQIIADRLELEAAAAVSREIVTAPTDPAEAADGERVPAGSDISAGASAELPPEPDAPSIDEAILTTLDLLAMEYGLDDVRGKELIVRMGLRVTQLAA